MNISRTALKLDTLKRSQKSGAYLIEKPTTKKKTKPRIIPPPPNPDNIISKIANKFTKKEWEEKIKKAAEKTAENTLKTGKYEWDNEVNLLSRDFISVVSPDRIGIINSNRKKGSCVCYEGTNVIASFNGSSWSQIYTPAESMRMGAFNVTFGNYYNQALSNLKSEPKSIYKNQFSQNQLDIKV